jgi:hypothetical protein
MTHAIAVDIPSIRRLNEVAYAASQPVLLLLVVQKSRQHYEAVAVVDGLSSGDAGRQRPTQL